MLINKKCSLCGKEKPLSEFHKNKASKDGYVSRCKGCISEYQKEYRAKNAAKLQAKQREYRQKNQEKVRRRQRLYWENNKERLKVKRDEYAKAHREEYLEYFRKRYREKKETIREKQKQYVKNNQKKVHQYYRKYYQEHKEKWGYNASKRKTRRDNDPVFRTKRNMNTFLWGAFNRRGRVGQERAHEILGCSLEEYTSHLKQTWRDRYGKDWNGEPCHIDHIVPLLTAKTEQDVPRLWQCNYLLRRPRFSHPEQVY